MTQTGGLDLLLGGDLGLWALEILQPELVNLVFTRDPDTGAQAAAMGFAVAPTSPLEHRGPWGATALSIHYPVILPSAVLEQYQVAYNVHPGLLPFGRGYFPVFWALWEESPAGATLHEMVQRVDAGPIVDQIEVQVSADDTGASLWHRVRIAERTLITRNWKRIASGFRLPSRPQEGGGTYHSRAEFVAMRDQTSMDDLHATDLLRLTRALHMPGHPGLKVTLAGRTYRLQLADGQSDDPTA